MRITDEDEARELLSERWALIAWLQGSVWAEEFFRDLEAQGL